MEERKIGSTHEARSPPCLFFDDRAANGKRDVVVVALLTNGQKSVGDGPSQCTKGVGMGLANGREMWWVGLDNGS